PEPQPPEHYPEGDDDRRLHEKRGEVRRNLKHEGWAGRRPDAGASGPNPARAAVLRLLGALGVCRQAVAGALVLGEERDLARLVDPLRIAAAHGALALENHTLVDDEARNADVPEDLARRVYLESLPRGHVPRDLPVHDDGRAIDLRVDHRGLADDQRVLRRD